MYPVEGGHGFLLETVRSTAQQQMHAPGRLSVPDIQDEDEWVQERHNDSVADGEAHLYGEILGSHCHKTGYVTRIIRRHLSEQILVR